MARKKSPVETENGKPVHGRNAKGEAICNADLKKKGRRCQVRKGLGPTGRCHIHNGAGVGRPAVHGLYVFPDESLQSRVLREMEDPDLTSLRGEIAVVSAFAKKFAGSFESYDMCLAWGAALKQCTAAREQLRNEELAFAKRSMGKLETLLEEGLGEAMKFQELFGYFAKKNVLVRTENQKMKDLAVMIGAKDQAAQILRIGTLINEIFDREEDAPRRARLAAELRAEIARGPGRDSRTSATD